MSHGKSKQEVLCDILNTYKTHPCIRQIEKKFNEQNFFRKEKFFFKPVTPPEMKNLINCLDTNTSYYSITGIMEKEIRRQFHSRCCIN